jgi:hypothetical protein
MPGLTLTETEFYRLEEYDYGTPRFVPLGRRWRKNANAWSQHNCDECGKLFRARKLLSLATPPKCPAHIVPVWWLAEVVTPGSPGSEVIRWTLIERIVPDGGSEASTTDGRAG